MVGFQAPSGPNPAAWGVNNALAWSLTSSTWLYPRALWALCNFPFLVGVEQGGACSGQVHVMKALLACWLERWYCGLPPAPGHQHRTTRYHTGFCVLCLPPAYLTAAAEHTHIRMLS